MRIVLLLAMCSVLVVLSSATHRNRKMLRLRTLLKLLVERRGERPSGNGVGQSISSDTISSSSDSSVSSSASADKPVIPKPVIPKPVYKASLPFLHRGSNDDNGNSMGSGDSGPIYGGGGSMGSGGPGPMYGGGGSMGSGGPGPMVGAGGSMGNGGPGPMVGGADPNGPGFLNLMARNCFSNTLGGLDQNTPMASPNEVKASLDAIRQFAEGMATAFLDHSDVIVNFEESLEQAPEAPSLGDFVNDHRNLVTEFLELVRNSTNDGICSFASLGMIFNRLMFVGGTHFDGSLCEESFVAVMEVDHMKQATTVDESLLHIFGELIRNDMKCIIQDIKHFIDHIEYLHVIIADGDLSYRDAQFSLPTIEAYASVLEHEINHFIYAVKRIDDLQREYVEGSDSYPATLSLLQKYLTQG